MIDALLIVVAWRRPVLGEARLQAIWRRLRRLQRGFAAVAARVLAGRAARVRAPRPVAMDVPAERPVLPDPGERLPRGRGWLRALLGEHAGLRVALLRHLLVSHPEMMALVASDPGFGRVLRPLFDMFGLTPPACVPPPQKFTRTPRRRAAAARAARPVKLVTIKPVTIKPVTGRALQKYLPWKGPRPLPKLKPRDAGSSDGLRKSQA